MIEQAHRIDQGQRGNIRPWAEEVIALNARLAEGGRERDWLRARVATLEEALRWYAGPLHRDVREFDAGDRARAALGEQEPDRCPTCENTDPKVVREYRTSDGLWRTLDGCPDPWHREHR